MEHHSNDPRGLAWCGSALGLYSTREDVDVLVTMLKWIAAGDCRGRYEPVPETGEYRPAGYEDPMPGYFSLTARASVSSPARGL